MPTFKEVCEDARKTFDESDDEVGKLREKYTAEAAEERVRRAREQQLASPTLASTPFPEAIQRATQRISKLSAAALDAASNLATAELALEFAETSLKRLQEAEIQYRRETNHNGHPATYKEWENLVDALFQRGVTKHTLKALSKVEVSFLADLIRWKSEDPKHQNPCSPWHAVFAGYAARTLEVVVRTNRPDLSKPSPPPPPANYGPRHWHFDPANGWSDGFGKGSLRQRALPEDSLEQCNEEDSIVSDSNGDVAPDDDIDLMAGEQPAAGSTISEVAVDDDEGSDASEVAGQEPHRSDFGSDSEPQWITPERAKALAKELTARSRDVAEAPWRLAGVSPDVKGLKLIPALEKAISEGNNEYAPRFLDAVKKEGTSTYIWGIYEELTDDVAKSIMRKEQWVIDDLRSLRFIDRD